MFTKPDLFSCILGYEVEKKCCYQKLQTTHSHSMYLHPLMHLHSLITSLYSCFHCQRRSPPLPCWSFIAFTCIKGIHRKRCNMWFSLYFYLIDNSLSVYCSLSTASELLTGHFLLLLPHNNSISLAKLGVTFIVKQSLYTVDYWLTSLW